MKYCAVNRKKKRKKLECSEINLRQILNAFDRNATSAMSQNAKIICNRISALHMFRFSWLSPCTMLVTNTTSYSLGNYYHRLSCSESNCELRQSLLSMNNCKRNRTLRLIYREASAKAMQLKSNNFSNYNIRALLSSLLYVGFPMFPNIQLTGKRKRF